MNNKELGTTHEEASKKTSKKFWQFKKNIYLCIRKRENNVSDAKIAEIAQLVEHNLAPRNWKRKNNLGKEMGFKIEVWKQSFLLRK